MISATYRTLVWFESDFLEKVCENSYVSCCINSYSVYPFGSLIYQCFYWSCMVNDYRMHKKKVLYNFVHLEPTLKLLLGAVIQFELNINLTGVQ